MENNRDLRRSATEAQLGLAFEFVFEIEPPFELRIEHELKFELAFDPETRPEAASRDRVDALDDDSPRGEGPRHMGETYRDHQRDARTEDEDDVFECALRARVRHHGRRRARPHLYDASPNRALSVPTTRFHVRFRFL